MASDFTAALAPCFASFLAGTGFRLLGPATRPAGFPEPPFRVFATRGAGVALFFFLLLSVFTPGVERFAPFLGLLLPLSPFAGAFAVFFAAMPSSVAFAGALQATPLQSSSRKMVIVALVALDPAVRSGPPRGTLFRCRRAVEGGRAQSSVG